MYMIIQYEYYIIFYDRFTTLWREVFIYTLRRKR